MKRVYFVLGTENSGNRMMVQCLCSAGCYGNPYKGELLGEEPYELRCDQWPDRVAFVRSVLHGGQVPDPISLASPMLQAGFQITPIHIYRKTDFAVAGHLKGNYARTVEESLAHIDLTARIVHQFGAYLKTPVVTISYELFVRRSDVRAYLFDQLDLPAPTHPLFNANEKYTLTHPPYAF